MECFYSVLSVIAAHRLRGGTGEPVLHYKMTKFKWRSCNMHNWWTLLNKTVFLIHGAVALGVGEGVRPGETKRGSVYLWIYYYCGKCNNLFVFVADKVYLRQVLYSYIWWIWMNGGGSEWRRKDGLRRLSFREGFSLSILTLDFIQI